MRQISAFFVLILLLAALTAGCAKNPEISISGQHDVTFEYRKN